MAKFCAKCGNPLDEGDAFCRVCGNQVKKKAGSFCRQCGNALKEDARFCPVCGAAAASAGPDVGASSPQADTGAPSPKAGERPGQQPESNNRYDDLRRQYAQQNQARQQEIHQGQQARQPQSQQYIPPQPAGSASQTRTSQTQTSQSAPKKKGKGGIIAGAIIGGIALVVVLIIVVNSIKDPRGGGPEGTTNSPITQSTYATASGGQTTGYTEAPTQTTAHQAENTQEYIEGGTWTVMVYICGSDLESGGGYATDNIKEMLDAYVSENVNLVLQTGGSRSWQVNGIPSDKLTRLRVTDDQLLISDQVGLASMGDGNTLKDFATWGMNTYPANRYMLILWNHGSEPEMGVEFDELFSYDSLSMDELRSGLEGLPHMLDIIGFDTCLMANIETASAVKHCADYMIASEEVIPGGGWNYTDFLNYLSGNSGCSPEELSRVICDAYEDKYAGTSRSSMITLSVLDLDYVNELEQDFAGMAAGMYNCFYSEEMLTNLIRGIYQADCYSVEEVGGEAYSNLFDIGNMASNCSSLLGSAGTDYLNCLSRAIIYKIQGSQHSGATGLSFFHPMYTDSQYLDDYVSAIDDMYQGYRYLGYLDKMWEGYWSAPAWVRQQAESDMAQQGKTSVSALDYDLEYKTDINQAGELVLDITKGLENVREIDAITYEIRNYNGVDCWLIISHDVFDDKPQESGGHFASKPSDTRLTIDGHTAPMHLRSNSGSSRTYLVPASIEGREVWLMVYYDVLSDKYSLLYAYGDEENEFAEHVPSREVIDLTEGMQITLQAVFVWEADMVSRIDLDTFTYHAASEVKKEAWPSDYHADYYYTYDIVTSFGYGEHRKPDGAYFTR